MKKRMCNRGSTLIEVIVCVLIIGIAFVPLMAGLSSSLRINRETENRLYAENVASNIVEICKTFGQQGFDDLKDINHDANNGIKAFLAGDDVELVKLSDNTFKIKKISSGAEDKYYWANVCFSYNPDNQNDFSSYPPVAGLSNAYVVSFDSDDLNDIINKLVFNDDVEKIKNNRKEEITPELLKNNVSEWLRRQIKVTINTTTVDGKTKYAVEGKMVYSVDFNATAGGNNIFSNTLIGSVIYESQPYENVEVLDNTGSKIDGKEYVAYEAPDSFNALPQSIIVAFSELKNEAGAYLDIPAPAVDNNMIIYKGVDGNVKVYALCSDLAAVMSMGHTPFYMYADGTTGTYPDYQISAYCNLNPLDDDLANPGKKIARTIYYTNAIPLKEFGEGLSGKQSKMKDVSVTIYEYNGAIEDTEKVVEKESTIIEFE